jgi:hypothetical protein
MQSRFLYLSEKRCSAEKSSHECSSSNAAFKASGCSISEVKTEGVSLSYHVNEDKWKTNNITTGNEDSDCASSSRFP